MTIEERVWDKNQQAQEAECKVKCHECIHCCFPAFLFGGSGVSYICTKNMADLSIVDFDKINEFEIQCDAFRAKVHAGPHVFKYMSPLQPIKIG